MLSRPARFFLSAGLLGLLSACNTSQPSTSAAAPAQPAVAVASANASPGSFNGVYRGTGTGNSRCGGTQSFAYPIRVSNGIASIQTNTAGVIEGPVSPDGTLLVQHGRQTLQGKFSDNSFNGTLAFGACGYTLNYARR